MFFLLELHTYLLVASSGFLSGMKVLRVVEYQHSPSVQDSIFWMLKDATKGTVSKRIVTSRDHRPTMFDTQRVSLGRTACSFFSRINQHESPRNGWRHDHKS